MLQRRAAGALQCAGRVAKLGLEGGPAFVYQVVADMAQARVVAGGVLGAGHKAAGNLVLAQLGAARQLLHRVPVAVARGEGAARVGPGRVAPQHLLHKAHTLKPVGPAQGADGAHAGDAVAHRELVGGLALVLLVNQRLDAVVVGYGLGLQPCHNRADVVVALVGAQPTQQVRGKGHWQHGIALRDLAHHGGLVGSIGGLVEQLLGPGVGLAAQRAGAQH